MMRKLSLLAALFLIIGCGKFRHGGLTWPARLASLEGFSAEQEERVLGAIQTLNAKVQRTMVSPEGVPAGSPIYIKWASDIPEIKSAIVGRAIIEEDRCTILILDAVANDDQHLIPVLWHELGHCAGLDHSADSSDIMFTHTSALSHYSSTALQRFFTKVLKASGLLSPAGGGL